MSKESQLLKRQWAILCNAYLKEFCKKHGYEEPKSLTGRYYWVCDDPGTIIEISDMFVGMDEIRYDIDNDIPEPMFEQWYFYSLELAELECPININYSSFCKGAPLPYSKKDLEAIRSSKKKVDDARALLEKCIAEDYMFKDNLVR